MDPDTSTEKLPHPRDLRQLPVLRCDVSFCHLYLPEDPNSSPFKRFRALSHVTCTSLFSLASHRSIFPKLFAYSSHRFLLKTKLTTGRRCAFLR